MRQTKKISVSNVKLLKKQLLTWSQYSNSVIWLDSSDCKHKYSSFDAILAVDANTSLTTSFHSAFEKLNNFKLRVSDWIFGYLNYDLKNDLEDLKSDNIDNLEFPDLFFFQPKKIFFLKDNNLTISYLKEFSNLIDEDLIKIQTKTDFNSKTSPTNRLKIHKRVSKERYIKQVGKLKNHINRGDIYEANYCQEFFSHGEIDPLHTFNKLHDLSLPPFSVFMKNNFYFLLSASPERYLKKEGDLLVSQPIKGTAKRSSDKIEDSMLKINLLADPKERSENVMIVDLVRNDLSRIAKKGSVNVEELHGIYSFKQVHHLISTVKANIRKGISSVDAIRASFPMGSMTGAPKISAMKIIDDVEDSKRGLYSGAVGYFTPNDDFDFNVIIRSILYNSNISYVSFSVGSAITSKSIAINEYNECLVKANAMHKVLEN